MENIIMKRILPILAAATLLASSFAQAQGLTREQVRQQLVEAQAQGLQYVTDASYPAVHPIYEPTVARMKAEANVAYGGVAEGTGAAAPAAVKIAPQSGHTPNMGRMHGSQDCVGPVSFCNIYSGG
jgi:hypothetical protein